MTETTLPLDQPQQPEDYPDCDLPRYRPKPIHTEKNLLQGCAWRIGNTREEMEQAFTYIRNLTDTKLPLRSITPKGMFCPSEDAPDWVLSLASGPLSVTARPGDWLLFYHIFRANSFRDSRGVAVWPDDLFTRLFEEAK